MFQGMLSILGALGLSIASLTVPAPSRYPDLWTVLISIYSCVHFLLFFLYFNYWQCVSEMDDDETTSSSQGKVLTYRRVEVKNKQELRAMAKGSPSSKGKSSRKHYSSAKKTQ